MPWVVGVQMGRALQEGWLLPCGGKAPAQSLFPADELVPCCAFCQHLSQSLLTLFPLFCRDFSWSPGGNIIAFWVPEDKDIPARVTLMQLPTRQEIRVRNLFNVVDCKLHWQKNGDYLCVKVDRTPKGTQVSGCHSFQLHAGLLLEKC